MADKRKPTDPVPVGSLFPDFESLRPMLQEVDQSKAITVQGRHHFNRGRQMDALQRRCHIADRKDAA